MSTADTTAFIYCSDDTNVCTVSVWIELTKPDYLTYQSKQEEWINPPPLCRSAAHVIGVMPHWKKGNTQCE